MALFILHFFQAITVEQSFMMKRKSLTERNNENQSWKQYGKI